MSLSCPFSEAHFCSLSSQSNVYGFAKLRLTGHTNKVLVASLSSEIVCLEYCNIKNELTPVSREVQFSYIPQGAQQGYAEIASIDVFTKYYGNGVIVGITFIKDSGDKFFNIYSDWEPGSAFNLDELAQSCQSIELQYVPYQLTHHRVTKDGLNETMFLLSGSDQRVHMFREDKIMHTFSEQSLLDFFPEFVNPLPGIALWIDMKPLSDSKRVTAVGCENGFVLCFLVDMENKAVIDSWSIEHSGPVTSVQLFTSINAVGTQTAQPHHGQGADHYGSMFDSVELDSQDITYHLLVTGALEVAVVYTNITTKGFSQQVVLPNSDSHDSTLCCCVCDLDFDGQNEIVLGTYGQELLAYKFFEYDDIFKEHEANNPLGEYKLLWQRSFSYPILAVDKIDITGDGVEELAVLTTKGVHILQHNLEAVMAVCLEKLKISSKQVVPKDDPFLLLQSETFSS